MWKQLQQWICLGYIYGAAVILCLLFLAVLSAEKQRATQQNDTTATSKQEQ